MGGIPFHLGEIHTISPRTRERMVGAVQVPAMQRPGLSLAGWSEARRGFYFVRQSPDASQLLATIAGPGEVWVDGAWRILRPGEAYATPPGAPHAYRATGAGIWHVCWAAYAAPTAKAWRFPLTAPAVLRAETEPLRRAIEGLCAAAGTAGEPELGLWVQLIHQRVLTTLQPGAAAEPRLGALWTRVNGDLAHPWTLDELARTAGLSREALRRHCLRECGRSPLREVTRLRLQRAAGLLRHTPDKIAAVAARVGFTDPFAFSTAFKRAHGAPPADYRAGRG
ncbi:MAG: Bifunctional transcriptional activator/DNA repair enzyme AdaA [Verrucomicrobiota bacterium]|jgi:AraC-like DNA-binding protein